MNYPIEVYVSGAISLGEEVCCDGFLSGASSRVQTHLHSDHMYQFDTSKGMQEIVLSEPTRQLLICENNADLPYRRNIKGIPECQWQDSRGSRISLTSSGHMLGAVQVLVVTPDGMRLGYSGDFRWPLSRVIQVDALVVDSTNGSPGSVRGFTQGECEEQLMSLVSRAVKSGPVYLRAHRGTIERALELVSTEVNCPIVASPRLCNTADVYRRHGYTIDELINAECPEGLELSQTQRVIQVYSTGDGEPYVKQNGTTIVLSAFASHNTKPVTEFSEKSFSVALSNHADFEGTLAYIEATGAAFVVTDNTRHGKGVELAEAIKRRLNVDARPSTHYVSKEWGR